MDFACGDRGVRIAYAVASQRNVHQVEAHDPLLDLRLVGQITSRNFLTLLLGNQLELPPSAWGTLQKAWIGFFYVTGIINLIVAYSCSTATWVNFKLFGLLALTFIFTIGISLWVMKKAEPLSK